MSSLKKDLKLGSDQFLFLLCRGSGIHSRRASSSHFSWPGEGHVGGRGGMTEAMRAQALLTHRAFCSEGAVNTLA